MIDCCNTCSEPIVQNTPGAPGAKGDPGIDGQDGISAFVVAANENPDPQPVMPAEGANVTVNVTTSTEAFPVGSIVYVQFWGWLRVAAVPSDTSLTLTNLEDTAAGEYDENAAPGTSLPALAKITLSGPQGPEGVIPGGVLLAANDLSDVNDPATSRTNLGLGSVVTFNEGTANGEVPRVDDGAGLTAGEAVFATANGLESLVAADARTAIGLGTAAVLDEGTANGDLPAVDDAGGLTNGEALFATASGIESLDAASARTALGITAQSNMAMLLYRQVESTGVGGGAFATGAWRTVPLNTEVVDTGNDGSIAANEITLAAGTYRYRYGVAGNAVNDFQARLYNITGAAVVANSYGTASTADSGSGATGFSHGTGRFTLGSSNVIRLEASCQTTGTFGAAASTGADENYSWIELWKEV